MTDDILKEVQWQDKKRCPSKTGDCLIEVNALAGLTVYLLHPDNGSVGRIDEVTRKIEERGKIDTL